MDDWRGCSADETTIMKVVMLEILRLHERGIPDHGIEFQIGGFTKTFRCDEVSGRIEITGQDWTYKPDAMFAGSTLISIVAGDGDNFQKDMVLVRMFLPDSIYMPK